MTEFSPEIQLEKPAVLKPFALLEIVGAALIIFLVAYVAALISRAIHQPAIQTMLQRLQSVTPISANDAAVLKCARLISTTGLIAAALHILGSLALIWDALVIMKDKKSIQRTATKLISSALFLGAMGTAALLLFGVANVDASISFLASLVKDKFMPDIVNVKIRENSLQSLLQLLTSVYIVGIFFPLLTLIRGIIELTKNRKALDRYDNFMFLTPNLIGFIVFGLFPVLFSLVIAFCEWDFINPDAKMKWIGIANFQKLFQMPEFWKYLANTAYFLIGIPLGMALSLLLAVALNQKIKLVTVYRTIYFLPYICSIVAIAILWLWLYNPNYGLINEFLRSFGVVKPPKWLADTALVKPAIMIMSIWKGLGYDMVLYLAALQGIPSHLYEAAEIDGANGWNKFWAITFPMLAPINFLMLIMGLIGTFQIFTEPYIMTKGGPTGSSTTIVYLIYKYAFEWKNMGLASAISWVLFFIIILLTIAQFRLAGKEQQSFF